MKAEKLGRNILKISLDATGDGWEKWFLLTSDRHHDSRHCDLALISDHMKMVRERSAHVLDFGDFFDAMQGKYDPRRSYPDLSHKYLRMMQDESTGYLDVIKKDAIRFYKKHADLFSLITTGNHETSIARHNDVNLTSGLVHGLNAVAGTNIVEGMYGGWVKFSFNIHKTQRQSFNLKYIHGYGGGGPVTKEVIQSNRQAVYLPDADIIVNGHIHETWVLPIARERFSKNGRIYHDNQYHVRTGTYKDGHGDGAEGWEVEKGMPPKSKGAVWMRFYYYNKAIRAEFTPLLG